MIFESVQSEELPSGPSKTETHFVLIGTCSQINSDLMYTLF